MHANVRWIAVGGLLASGVCAAYGVQVTQAHARPVAVSSAKIKSSKSIEKADVLFVVDNSNSMSGEQASLQAAFPKLINALTRGERYPGDPEPFTPIRDLHIGVVSSDMGIPGVEYPPCHADGGDDGRLQHTGHPSATLECKSDYPTYLSYEAGSQDADQLAKDFSCIASLGTGGCGFEEQLEASFKAVWPSVYTNANGDVVSTNPYYFASTTQEGTLGRGDVPADQGGNGGFLRNDPEDPSLLVIVLVTDEEDCSVSKTEQLKPNNQLPEDSPYRNQDINLRCFYNQDALYDLKARYLEGFRKLRPGREDLVAFSAIVGVPIDLVSSDVLAKTDFTDTASRDKFYEAILTDPRMVYTPDANVGTGQGNLVPSCSRYVPGDAGPSTAYPPRRIVELARGFGENGIVQSICQDDFTPAIEQIVNLVAKKL